MKVMISNTVIGAFLIGMLISACSGGGTASGGSQEQGDKSVATAVRSSVSTTICLNGGIAVDAGIDRNGNGILDPSEVMNTQYVCNGTNGTNGTNGANGTNATVGLTALVSVVTDSAGTNCSYGGKKVSVGFDTNADSVLDNSEITSSHYICNGASGANGTNGTNGNDALNSLTSIFKEPASKYCYAGGSQVTSGLDTNSNGVLDASEVTSTQYVCNGTNGTNGMDGTNGATGPAGPGVTWVIVTDTSVQAVSNTGYMTNNTAQVTVTLPTSPAVGDVIQVSGIGSGGWRLAQNPGQSIITKDLPGGIGAAWTARPQYDTQTRTWNSVASSSDGTKLVAVVNGGQIYTSADSGVSWTARDINRNWYSVASSSDGIKLVAVVVGANEIYTSTDSGANWTVQKAGIAANWQSVASSSDGTKLVAVAYGGQIYTSVNSGLSWTPRDANRAWFSVASSSDGTKLAAVVQTSGQIYTSTDSGVSWTARDTNRNWYSVASSSDGMKLVAAVYGGQIYTSTDAGISWTARDTNRNWYSVTSSSDGRLLVAVTLFGQIYTSADSGATWTARDTDRGWFSVASSSDGTKLVAVVSNGRIYTSSPQTATGTIGTISGGQYDAIELQYIGNDMFMVLSHEGYLTVYSMW